MALSLLLADDQPAIAKIISLSLPKEEYEIQSVSSVKEAMNAIAASRPDFFLVDVSLRFDAALDPAMNPDHPDIKKDGIYLTRYIKEHDQLRSIQVIMLTNAFEPIDDDTRRRYNADGVLVKPFEPSELRTALRDLMNDGHRQKLQSGSASANSVPEHHPISDSTTVGLAPGELVQPNPEVVDEPTKNLPALDLTPDPLEEKEKEAGGGQTDSYFSDAPDIDIASLSPEAQELSSFFANEIETNADPAAPSSVPPTAPLTSPPLAQEESTPSGFIDPLDEGQTKTTPTNKIPPSNIPSSSPNDLSQSHNAPASNANAESFHFNLNEVTKNNNALVDEFESTPALEESNPSHDKATDILSGAIPTAPPKTADPLSAMPESIDSAADEWKPVHPNVEDDLSAWQQTTPNSSKESLFDTGGSSFEFQNDYINKVKKPEEAREDRATQSQNQEYSSLLDEKTHHGITATPDSLSDEALDEFAYSMATKRFSMVPDDDDALGDIQQITEREVTKRINLLEQSAQEQLQSKIIETSEALTQKATDELAGQLSESREKLEALIREETRKQCTELVQKIAWDIIPELAENIIRKELDKVLKALEKDPE